MGTKIIQYLMIWVFFLSFSFGTAMAAPDGMERTKTVKLNADTATSVAISSDDFKLVIGLGKDGIGWYDIRNPKALYLLKQIKTPSAAVSVAYDGKKAFVGMENGQIAFVDLKKGTLSSPLSLGSTPVHLSLSSKGDRLIAVNGEKAFLFEGVKNQQDLSLLTKKEISFDLSGEGIEHHTKANPVYAVFSPDGKKAAIALQKNNAMALIQLENTFSVKVVSLGVTTHRADVTFDGIPWIEDSFAGRLEAGAIAFSPKGDFIYTANEGARDLPVKTNGIWSGGRNFSIFSSDGALIYDGQDKLEQSALVTGAYPDQRSLIRGIEPNGVAIGWIEDKPAMAMIAREANGVFVFGIEQPNNPFFFGMTASGGRKPVALTGFNKQDGFIVVDEDGIYSFYLPILNTRERGTGH